MKFAESQTNEVGQVLQRPRSPNPRPKQAQLKRVIYEFVQLSPEYLQEGALTTSLGTISIFDDPCNKEGFPTRHLNCSHSTLCLLLLLFLQHISKKSLLCAFPLQAAVRSPHASRLMAEHTQFSQPLPVRHVLLFPNHLGNLPLNSGLVSFFTGEPQTGNYAVDALLGWVKKPDSAIGNPTLSVSNIPPVWEREVSIPLLATCAHNQAEDFAQRGGYFSRNDVRKKRVSADN